MRRSRAKRPTDRERIIELFAERTPYYARSDVLRLTCSSEEEVTTAIHSGEITPAPVPPPWDELYNGEPRVFSWEDVVHLAYRRWTPRMIDAALARQLYPVLPRPQRVRRFAVHLPLYQLRLLHYLAEQRGTARIRLNASDILERVLHDLANTVAAEAEAAMPGFREALRYPYFIPRDDSSVGFCQYCDQPTAVGDGGVCETCSKRHEPEIYRGEDGLPELDEES